jgi:preprotein translocase subunit SecF
MFILKYKKIFLAFSSLLILISLVALIIFKLQLSIEFTGGTILDFSTSEQIEESVIKERINTVYSENYILRNTENGYSLRTKTLSEEEKQSILTGISNNTPENLTIIKLDTIGPTLGSELKNKALVALILVVVSVALFIAYAFRHVSKPVSSWKYGIITLIALVHDIAITIGIFAFLGYFIGMEVDSLFLTALLVILGYSINDTIVVFDRIRENLLLAEDDEKDKNFDEIVGHSLSQTFVRSINTSFTTLMAITIIWIFTTGSVQNFALALFIGIASGTYSSLFVAAPLLTYFKSKEVEA